MSESRSRFWWCYVVGCSLIISTNTFMLGYDIGTSNGIKEMDGFRETFNLSLSLDNNSTASCSSTDDDETSAILGLVVSLYSLGSLVGGLLGGFLSDFRGRKSALIIGSLFCATGAVIQTSSFHVWMLLVGRIWTGLGNGIVTPVVSLYIAEISPKQFRGKLIGLSLIWGTSAFLIGSVVDAGVENIQFGWRISAGLLVVIGCFIVLGTVFLPESPRWLIKKNKLDKAMKSLKKIYRDDAISEDCFKEIAASCNKSDSERNWEQLFSWTVTHRLCIGFSLMFLSRISGMPLLLYFSVSIFCKLGISGFIGAIVIGLSFIVFHMIGLIAINDRIGRKIILLAGFAILCLCLIVAAILTMDFGFEEDSLESNVTGYLVVVIVAFFVGVCMLFIISQVLIIVSEIFPLKISGEPIIS